MMVFYFLVETVWEDDRKLSKTIVNTGLLTEYDHSKSFLKYSQCHNNYKRCINHYTQV